MDFRQAVVEGIPNYLPQKKEYDLTVNHAPKRKEILNIREKKLSTVLRKDLPIWSTFIEVTERRNLYGKAGCFRLTPYGVEYRVLSGYFLKTKALEEWVFKNTYLAINKLVEMWKDDNTSWYWNIIDNFDIQSIINNNQVKQAEEIITNILRIK